jgi:hypothetical protein
MRRGLWLGIALAAVLTIAPAAAHAERPLVYTVVIDGLDGDRVDEGKAPFISSLLAERATYYRESRSVMIAETNPNHVAMMTGAYGNASGLPGNAFALYAPLAGEDSCQAPGPVDETKPPSVTSGESSGCLLAETVFGAIRRQGNPDGLLTAAIFGKPKLGRIFAGGDVDHLWAPCSSGADDDSYCGQVPTAPEPRTTRRSCRPTTRSSGSLASCAHAASGSAPCSSCSPTTRWTRRSRRPT